jgi:thiamine kinase-like enzyme
MEIEKYQSIAKAFGIENRQFQCNPFGTGHINFTFGLQETNEAEPDYILQKINTHVFPDPEKIASNWNAAESFIRRLDTDYQMIKFLPTMDGNNFFRDEDGEYWRLIPFVKNTFTCETVETPEQAYQTASAFGNLTRLLNGVTISDFQTILSDFHNLSFREWQFNEALAKADFERLEVVKELLITKKSFVQITTEFESIQKQKLLPIRIFHIDAKISNILFSKGTRLPVCIVDYDTLMPGTILSDVGDMLRSMTSDTVEDEADLSKIKFREDFVASILDGYLDAMKNIITINEKRLLYFGGIVLVYMQAIRFLTDYLENDRYYHIAYSTQNLVRAQNQFRLLALMAEKRTEIERKFLV